MLLKTQTCRLVGQGLYQATSPCTSHHQLHWGSSCWAQLQRRALSRWTWDRHGRHWFVVQSFSHFFIVPSNPRSLGPRWRTVAKNHCDWIAWFVSHERLDSNLIPPYPRSFCFLPMAFSQAPYAPVPAPVAPTTPSVTPTARPPLPSRIRSPPGGGAVNGHAADEGGLGKAKVVWMDWIRLDDRQVT